MSPRARKRQLERLLARLEALRLQQGLEVAPADEAAAVALPEAEEGYDEGDTS